MVYSANLAEVEQRLRQLTPAELESVERTARKLLRSRRSDPGERRAALARMAADPQIIAEVAAIDEEFAGTEMDGLERPSR